MREILAETRRSEFTNGGRFGLLFIELTQTQFQSDSHIFSSFSPNLVCLRVRSSPPCASTWNLNLAISSQVRLLRVARSPTFYLQRPANPSVTFLCDCLHKAESINTATSCANIIHRTAIVLRNSDKTKHFYFTALDRYKRSSSFKTLLMVIVQLDNKWEARVFPCSMWL